MKTLPLLFGTVLLFTANAFSQFSSPDVKVNGVGLGASHREVISKLGKPSRDYTVEADECVGGKSRILIYRGLTVEMHPRAGNPKEFYVGQFEVTSPRWNVSGVRVGAGMAAIRKKFGPSSGLRNGDKKGEKFLPYYLNAPGNLYFHFRRAKLVRIETHYIC